MFQKTISVEYFLGYFNQLNQEPDYIADSNNELKPKVTSLCESLVSCLSVLLIELDVSDSLEDAGRQDLANVFGQVHGWNAL